MNSSVNVREAPWERASVRRGMVEARTMGAMMVELLKSSLATSWAERWAKSGLDMIVVVLDG